MGKLEQVLEQLVVEVRALRQSREHGSVGPGTKPMAVREAAAAMGIGVNRLRTLIHSGEVATCAGSSRLVPISEIERWCRPRPVAPRGRDVQKRDAQGRTKSTTHRTYSSNAAAEATRIREELKAERGGKRR